MAEIDRCNQLHPRPATPSDENLCGHIVRVTMLKFGTAADVGSEPQLQQECLAGLAESSAEMSSTEYSEWKNCVIMADNYEVMQEC